MHGENQGYICSMKFKIAVVIFCALFLSACAAPPPPPPGFQLSQSENSLAEASYSVSRSLVELSATAQAAHPHVDIPPPPNPASYGMAGLTTLDWSGPVEPLMRQVANAANYRLVVLGTPPAIPVLVTVYEKNAMLGDVVRDIGYQCGRRADVSIYPDGRVIELRYAKN